MIYSCTRVPSISQYRVGGARLTSLQFRLLSSSSFQSKNEWPSSFVRASKAEDVLKSVNWPVAWPYAKADFNRIDEDDDATFYAKPRFESHVDVGFTVALQHHYASAFACYSNARLLDICASWTSHYPAKKTWSKVSLLGMNRAEIKHNDVGDDISIVDLNNSPVLPYDAGTFDVVTCALSFDYLVRPLEVMNEIARVLKPGGKVILSTSDRCFPTKVAKIWSRTNDMEHVLIYGSYIHYSRSFEPPVAFDLTARAENPVVNTCYIVSPYAVATLACLVVDAIGGRGLPALLVGAFAYFKCPGAPDPVYVIQATRIA